MRNEFLVVALAFPLMGIAWTLYFHRDLKVFLASTPEILTEMQFAEYKRIVGRQMHSTLVLLAFFAVGAILLAAGLYLGRVYFQDLVPALLLGPVCTLLAVWLKRTEQAFRSIPVLDPRLSKERDHVLKVWDRKMLPDW